MTIAHNILLWITIIGSVMLSMWIGAAFNKLRQSHRTDTADVRQVRNNEQIAPRR